MSKTSFRAPLSPSAEVNLFELGSRGFELLCGALHEREPDILTAYLSAPDGQKQFGVDHIANRKDGAIELGQAKAYRSFSRANVVKAIQEFTDHWDTHWKSRQVTRLILFIGCAVKSADAQDAMSEQEKELAKLGIKFEWWDATRIVGKLRDHRALVQHYVRPLLDTLFERTPGPFEKLASDAAAGNTTSREVLDIVSGANSLAPDLIDAVTRDVQHGRGRQAEDRIVCLRRNVPYWEHLPLEVRGKIVRLQASMALRQDDVDAAIGFVREAEAIDGVISRRHEALIAMEVAGPEAALAKLEDDEEPSSQHVRAVAYLRLDRPNDALLALGGDLASASPQAETFRLEAIALLVLGRRAEAVERARKAVSIDPKAEAPRQTLGTILYNAAMAPGAPTSFGSWPEPISTALVRRDDAAQACLREAAEIFGSLVADCGGADANDRRAWQLAATLCQAGGRDAGQALLDAALQADGANAGAITYAINRGLEFDREAVERVLDERIANTDDLEAVLVRCILHLTAKQGREALRLLTSKKQAFVGKNQQDHWAYWCLVARVDTGQKVTPADLARYPQFAIRAALAKKGKSQQIKQLEQVAGDPSFLLHIRFDAVERLASRNAWHAVQRVIGGILDEAPTAEVVNLAALAYHNTARFTEALDVLGRTDVFPEGRLPTELQRLRTACLAGSGRISAAAKAATEIMRTTKEAADVTTSLEMLMRAGRHRDAAAVYRENASLLKRPSATHIRLASMVATTDPDTAKAIVGELVQGELPDELVQPLLTIAMKLGFSEAQRVLVPRFEEIAKAGKHGARKISLNEIVRMTRASAQKRQEMLEDYRRGQAPVYLLSQGHPEVLPRLFLERTEACRRNAAAGPSPLLARSGTEPMALRVEDNGKLRIVADFTGLMTAFWLGALDAIEKAFAPIYISPHLLGAIVAARLNAEDAQPSQARAHRRVVELTEVGDLGLVADDVLDQWVEEESDHYKVAWSVNAKTPARSLNMRRLFLQLKDHGGIADDIIAGIELELGSSMRERPAGPKPRPGAAIVLVENTATVLEEAGALDYLRAIYELSVTPSYVELARAEIASRENAQRLGERLAELESRLAREIDAGTYVVLPSITSKKQPSDAVTASFFDTIDRMPDEDGVFWFDDRLMTTIRSPEMTVASTIEIIDALVAGKAVTEDQAYRWRQELRRAQYLFVPLKANELVSHLTRARFAGGQLTLTDDLNLLERYTALTFLHCDALLYGAGKDELTWLGELKVLTGLGQACTNAITQIWNDKRLKTDRCIALCDWVIGCIDPHVRPVLPAELFDTRFVSLLGVHLAGLMSGVLQLDWPLQERDAPLRIVAYAEWAWGVVQGELREAPRAAPFFYASLAGLICNEPPVGPRGPQEKRLWRMLSARAFNVFPEEVRDRLLERDDVRTFFRAGSGRIVTFNGLRFPDDKFWNAVRLAAEGAEPARLKDLDGKGYKLVAQAAATGHEVRVEADGLSLLVDPVRVGLTSEDLEVRRGALRAGLAQVDYRGGVLDAEVNRVADLAPATERQKGYGDLLSQTFGSWKSEVRDIVASGRFKSDDLLPPSAVGFLRFSHIDQGDTDFPRRLDAAAESLIATHGLRAAVNRLAALPVAVPGPIEVAFASITPVECEAWLAELETSFVPPWEAAWILHLVDTRRSEVSGADERIVRAVGRLLNVDDMLSKWAVFGAVAIWLENEAPKIVDWDELSTTDRLAFVWGCAGAIGRLLLQHLGDFAELAKWFSNIRDIPLKRIAGGVDEMLRDKAHPLVNAPRRVWVSYVGLLSDPLARTPSAFVEQVRKFVFANANIPFADLIRLNDIGTDLLSTTLSVDAATLFDFLGDDSSNLSPAFFRQHAIGLFSDTQTNGAANLWQFLFIVSRPLTLDPELATMARQRLVETEFSELEETEQQARTNVFRAACEVALYNGFTEAEPHLRLQLNKLLAAETSDEESSRLNDLLEAGASIARMALTDTERALRLGQLLEQFARAKPALHKAMSVGATALASKVQSGAFRPLVQSTLRLQLTAPT